MKIVFVGRRQARQLCETAVLCGAQAHWIDAGANLYPRDEARLDEADKLAVQVGSPIAFDLDALAPKADRVLFPQLSLDFLWPFGGQPHARNTRDAFRRPGPYPVELGDAWLNRRLDGRERLEAVEAEYLALDIAEILDLDAYKTMALERQGEIDAACGEDYASRFEASFREKALFLNPLAPTADLLRELANATFAKLGAPFTLTQDWAPEGFVAELPVHPSVARHFGLAWTQGRRYRVWPEDGIEFDEYVRRYLAYAEGPELEAGVRHLAEARVEAGLALLETATARPMGRRSSSARQAMTRGYLLAPRSGEAASLLRQAGALNDDELFSAAELCATGRWREAEAAILARAETAPSAEVYAFLAFVREKRGDTAGRVAALRSGLTLRPLDRPLQRSLTFALAAVGDAPGAIASAGNPGRDEPARSARARLPRAIIRARRRQRARQSRGERGAGDRLRGG